LVALPEAKTAEVQAAILRWYRQQGRELPWRRTHDPYAILIAEAMLQQTQVDRVRPKWEAFLEAFPTLRALAAAPRADVIRAWAGLGYNRRAVSLHEIARTVVDAGGDTLPSSVEALRALPGVGPYTAAAIACFAFGLPEAVFDTNVRRVLDRIFAIEASPGVPADRHGWATARAALPADADVYEWNQALMDLGATVCVARAPRCDACPVRESCAAVSSVEVSPTMTGPIPLPGLEGFARVAEAPASYRPTSSRRPTERFEGSRRWYRGRAVAALRALAPGATMGIDALGALVDPEYEGLSRRAWLLELLGDLARDGLVVVIGEGEASVVRLA
jgi:A/G-specific adenine glycosylase